MVAALMRKGLREVPELGGFRSPVLCPDCREFEIQMIRTLRQDNAEGSIERERAALGEPPLAPEVLERAARKRWDQRQSESSSIIAVGAAGN